MMATPDVWQKMADVSGLASGIIVALIGGTATYILTQRQRKADDYKASRELVVHRIQTVQAFISNLGSKDEREKEAALLAINALGDPELASKLAEIYGGEGSAAAMSRIASISTGSEANKAEESLAVLFDSMLRSVFRIDMRDSNGQRILTATGFVVAANRLVTTAHAVQADTPAGSIVITSRDGQLANGIVLRLDQQVYLAVIEVDTGDTLPLQLDVRSHTQQTMSEEVSAIGYGDGHEEVRVGRVIGTIDGPGRPAILTSEISMPGFSGAPALNNKGHVVGVVRTRDRKRSATHLIPARLVSEFLSGA